MRILPDGTIEITNNQTGEKRIVQPSELPKYGLSLSPQSQTNEQDQQLELGNSSLPPTKTGHTLDEITQTLRNAQAAGDTKAVKQLTSDLNTELSYQKDFIQAAKDKATKESQPAKADVEKQKKNEEVGKSLDLLIKNLGEVESRGKIGGTLGSILANLTGGSVNPETLDYEALRRSLIGPLARTISQEKGVLTDLDIKRAEGLLPKITEDPKVVENKIANLNTLLSRETKQIKKDKPENSKEETAKTTQTDTLGGKIDALIAKGRKKQDRPPGNALSEALFPRLTDQARKVAKGEKPSLNEQVGSLGELGSNILPFIPGVGLPAKLALSGAISGLTDPKKGVGGRITSGALQAAGGAALGKGAQIAGKLMQPFKTVGEARAASIAEASGKKISGDKIIKGLEKGLQDVSPTAENSYKKFLEVAKGKYGGKKLTVEQVVNLNTAANDAYTQAGKVGKAATAKFNKALGDILKTELEITAPKVAEANKNFSRLYGLKKVGEQVVNPRTIGGAIGGAGVYALFKKLGL